VKITNLGNTPVYIGLVEGDPANRPRLNPGDEWESTVFGDLLVYGGGVPLRLEVILEDPRSLLRVTARHPASPASTPEGSDAG